MGAVVVVWLRRDQGAHVRAAREIPVRLGGALVEAAAGKHLARAVHRHARAERRAGRGRVGHRDRHTRIGRRVLDRLRWRRPRPPPESGAVVDASSLAAACPESSAPVAVAASGVAADDEDDEHAIMEDREHDGGQSEGKSMGQVHVGSLHSITAGGDPGHLVRFDTTDFCSPSRERAA